MSRPLPPTLLGAALAAQRAIERALAAPAASLDRVVHDRVGHDEGQTNLFDTEDEDNRRVCEACRCEITQETESNRDSRHCCLCVPSRRSHARED